MKSKTSLTILIVTLALSLAAPALAAPRADAVDQALGWLSNQQNADGGFSNGFSTESSLAATAEAVIALAAGRQDPSAVRSAENGSPLDYLSQQVSASQVEGVGTTAKVVLALVAAGQDAKDFAGHDLVDQINATYDADSGSYGGSIFDQALAVLALANAGQAVPSQAIDYLLAFQNADGAWNFVGDTAALTGDTNTTALVIQALVAAGHKDDAGRALDYLRRVQNSDAGWPYQNPSAYGTETDANSTALVLQAIYAVGQTPDDWYVDGSDPLGALLSLQNANGSFGYQASFRDDNVLATIQAIPAVVGVTLANVRRVPATAPTTTVDISEDPTPAVLPAAGDATPPAISGLVLLGLALFGAGLWLGRLWNRQTNDSANAKAARDY